MLESRIMNTMPRDVASDMSWSAKVFNEQVWPIIQPFVGRGDLLQMEGRPDTELAKELDMRAGIDGWHVHQNGMRGIASRVQVARKPKNPFNSFTIRLTRNSGAATEYQKRMIAINGGPEKGWIYPFFTVQAYTLTTTGPVLSCGVARTIDIMDYIQKHGPDDTRETSNATFGVCWWHCMQNKGYDVLILKPERCYHFWDWNILGLSPQNLQVA